MNIVIREKMMAAINIIKRSLVQRDAEIDMIFAAILARHHALLVGQAGVAKSLLVSTIQRLFSGSKVFSVQMCKDTSREFLFGPMNVPALVRGESYERILANGAADSHLLILEEVYNGSPGSLNMLLTLMNERVYMEGMVRKNVPLMSVLGTSNFFKPEGCEESVNAFGDRFLFRKEVKPVVTSAGLRRLSRDPEESFTPVFPESLRMSLADLEQAQADVKAMPRSEEALDVFDRIVFDLYQAGVQPSNRRLVWSRRACQARAYLSGHSQVEKSDLAVLVDTMWDQPEGHPGKTLEIVMNIVAPVAFAVSNIYSAAEQTFSSVRLEDHAACNQAVKKLEKLCSDLSEYRGSKEAAEAEKFITTNIKALKVAAVKTTM